VHPNTVVQRIRRAEHLLGHPIDTADLSFRVALHLAPGPRTIWA
jgi:DNA-binding PucR family transcriptional regulator